MVAAAVVGGAAISAVGSTVAGGMAADASADASRSAANATIESTRLQIEEIGRQFDYQTELLAPMVQSQYDASGAYSNLLGLNRGGSTESRDSEISDLQGQLDALRTDRLGYPDASGNYNNRPDAYGTPDAESALEQRIASLQDPNSPQYPGAGSTEFNTGDRDQFIDPNLDQTRLQDVQQLPGQVRNTLLAGTSAEDDPFRNYLQGNRIAAGSADQDARVMRADQVRNAGPNLAGDAYRTDVEGRQLADGAAGTGVYGNVFNQSPGYSFQREEMERQLERGDSAGGNYGGRAIMEAQRRGQGLAAGDYYNWAAGRERDLGRRGQAEYADAARLDDTARNYLQRQQIDIGRGDTALSQYEGQRTADVQRDDMGYLNFMDRQGSDNARLDSATAESDRLAGVDRSRDDQAYYNYLSNVGRVAGFGDSTAQAVQSSQNAGNAATSAYRNQGNYLSSNYINEGNNQANIILGTGANINDSIQAGIGNYLTASEAGLIG